MFFQALALFKETGLFAVTAAYLPALLMTSNIGINTIINIKKHLFFLFVHGVLMQPVYGTVYTKVLYHRRRMELKDKAKVVASVWGAKFVQFLAALAVLPWSILKKRLNSSFFQSDRGKTASTVRN